MAVCCKASGFLAGLLVWWEEETLNLNIQRKVFSVTLHHRLVWRILKAFFYLRIYFHDVKCSSLGSLTQVTNRSWQQFSVTCRGVVWRHAKQIYCHFSSSAWHVLVCWRHGHRRETRGCLPGGRYCDFAGLKQRSCPSKHLTASWTPRADCCWCAGACPPSGEWGGTVTFWWKKKNNIAAS